MGTFTLQDMPDFARRNAARNLVYSEHLQSRRFLATLEMTIEMFDRLVEDFSGEGLMGANDAKWSGSVPGFPREVRIVGRHYLD